MKLDGLSARAQRCRQQVIDLVAVREDGAHQIAGDQIEEPRPLGPLVDEKIDDGDGGVEGGTQREHALAPAAEVINFYGPTETTMIKCYYRVPDLPEAGVQPELTGPPSERMLAAYPMVG